MLERIFSKKLLLSIFSNNDTFYSKRYLLEAENKDVVIYFFKK